MDIELKIKISTLEELENILKIENLFYYMKIFPTCFYDSENKIRSINLISDLNKKQLILLKDKIEFNVEPDTNRFNALMSIENLLKSNKINFDTGYLFENKTRLWYLDIIDGPMEISTTEE